MSFRGLGSSYSTHWAPLPGGTTRDTGSRTRSAYLPEVTTLRKTSALRLLSGGTFLVPAKCNTHAVSYMQEVSVQSLSCSAVSPDFAKF